MASAVHAAEEPERDSLRKSWELFRSGDAYLAGDLRFVARRLTEPRWTPIASMVDSTRIGFLGHSTGGSVVSTASAGWNGPKRRALVVYDVILPGVLFEYPITTPSELFRTTATNHPPGWAEVLLSSFDQVRAKGFAILVDGGTHQGFSDRPFLAAADSSARATAWRQLEATARYTRDFLDRYLKNASVIELTDSLTAARHGVRITRRRP